ncbi:hypothetical protein [uncultured Aquimarina sp.]|uniref:hypothetical protein n=1 Tax=uncultured Aquimarina sp. TaxID=575652 RepID=UPI00262D3B7E|nr:hypothetical protein [uncultured Aquimarina sp.]
MKYELSEETKQIFLLQIHEIINKTVYSVIKNFKDSKSDFLFDQSLLKEEEQFFNKIKKSPLACSIIEELLRDGLDSAFFNLTNLIDGISAPNPEFGKWNEVLLIDKPKDFEEDPNFMKESFHEAYDIWEKMNSLNK